MSILPQFIFLRFYLFTFRERGWEGEREGAKHPCVREMRSVASDTPPLGDLVQRRRAPDWELNQRSFRSQAHTQSTEPHQSGWKVVTDFSWEDL